MTLSYYADRVNLAHGMRRFPHWSAPQLAHALQRSESWVKKWRKRLRPLLSYPAALLEALQGQSRAPNHPPARLDPQVEEAILSIRDSPPEGLRRTPGPKAIQYYLQRDATLQVLGLAGSHSTRTIYQVLVKHQRIVLRKPARAGANGAPGADDALANRLQRHFQRASGLRWKEATGDAILQYRRYGHIARRCCSCER